MTDSVPEREATQRDVETVSGIHGSIKLAQSELYALVEVWGQGVRMFPQKWCDEQELRLRREGKWSEEVE